MAMTTRRVGGRAMHPAVTTRPKVPVCRAPPVCAVGLPEWGIMYNYLVSNQGGDFTSVGATEGKAMLDSGEYVLVDVRPKEDFEKSTAEGAKSVPLFQRIGMSNLNAGNFLKGLAFALNGVQAVEINPEFSEQMKAAADDKKVLLCCDTGGTMQPSTNFLEGKTSRSLKAAFLVSRDKLAPGAGHLDGGMVAWVAAGLPTTGEYDDSVAGRSPNSAEEPEIDERFVRK